jgi:hypothetical protein
MALGAVLVGALASESLAVTRINAMMEPMRHMFGAVFFVAVGLMLDPGMLLQHSGPVLAVTAIILAGKFTTNTLGSLLTGHDLPTAVRVGGSMAQVGEFAFIIAALGVSLHATREPVYQVGVGAAVLSIVCSAPLLLVADRLATLWGGFAVFAPDLHLIYTGDTGYSPDFKEIRRRFATRQAEGGFDLALIPVGAYEPRWFMGTQHVNPAEAIQVHLDLGARRSVGVHWGTFSLSDESLDEPPRALERARREAGLGDADFGVMAIGQTLQLPRRRAPMR